MTKLFKNSKSILSLVLAFAVLAVSLFTGVVINSDAANCDDDLNVVYITYGSNANGEPDGSFMDGTHGTGTETDPYVISTPGQLRHLAQKTTYAQTHGKFFEIDDSIDIMVLQSEGYINTVAGSLDAFLALDAEGVKDAFATTTNRAQWQSSTTNAKDCFAGTLNGNGVKIVGAYNQNGGIIAYVNDGATAKNITVEHCMFETGWFAGSIFGYSYPSDTLNATGLSNENCPGVITFDNVTVHDNYTKVSGNAQQNTGALFGDCATFMGVKVNGCLVYDCKLLAETGSGTGNFADHPFAFGDLSTGHNGDTAGYPVGSYTNSVFIGCAPWTYTTSNQAFKPAYYSAVYTDCAAPSYQIGGWATFDKFVGITVVDTANAKGTAAKTNMPNIDWANTWVAVDGEYPELRSNHNIKIVDNGDGTHKEACEDCGLNIGTVKHSFTAGVCACGYKAKCGEVVLYWDGTSTAPASKAAGTQADPIIINTAAELNYVLRQAGPGATTGKYFKVADGIDQIVLQPEGVLDVEALLACKDGAAVKAYFDTLDASTLKTWNGGGVFNGNIDGNGVQIVGLYDTTTNLAGLVGAFDGGKQFTKEAPGVDNVGNTIKGFTVSHSYLESNNRIGVFGSQAYANGWGAYVSGTWTVDTCAVINCHIKQTAKAYGTGHSGIVAGDVNADVVKFNNLIVYGNDATDMNGATLWIRGGGLSSQKIIVDGVETEEFNYCSTTNSIILGALPYMNDWIRNILNDPASFSNVYTDAPVGEVTFANGTGFTYEESQLKSIEGLTGAELKEACAALDWTNTFMATADMPTFRAMHDAEFAATYNDETHSLTCSCGLVVESAPHDWSNKDGVCAAGCGYECVHGTDGDAIISKEKTPADCTNAAWYYDECTICGISSEEMEDGLYQEGEALGHDMKFVEGTPAKCGVAGVKDYYDCSRCDYVSEDAAGEKEITNLDEWKVIPALDHVAALDDQGKTIYAWDDATPGMHYNVCDLCGEKYNGTTCTGEYVFDDEGHEGECTVCGIATAGKEAHSNFDENHKCGTCDWVCTNHVWVDDGEPVELGMEATDDACMTQAQKCDICGAAGENRIIAHELSEWQTNPRMPSTPACAGEGSHTEIRSCTVCYYSSASENFTRTVTDPKIGHAFDEFEASEPSCLYKGEVAHKYCPNCSYSFAMDAAEDEPYENALTDEELYIPADPEAHVWVEYAAGEADCENDGYSADHKFCSVCKAFVVDGEDTNIVLDYDKFYEAEYDEEGNLTPIGVGAIADVYATELMDEMFEQWLADQGIVLPEMPAEDADWEEWNAYYEEYYTIMDGVDTAEFEEMWNPILEEIWSEAYHQYFLAEAEAAGIIEVEAALGHNIVKVDEVPATYEKEGVKAHYACKDCGTLYADAEGTTVVTEEELVIAKLVKEEEKPADKPADTEGDKPAGDNGDKSPATGENVASVAAVAALMGAAFVLVRKARKG